MGGKTRLLILTEAGEGIGFGHVMRCGSLHRRLVRDKAGSLVLLNMKGNEAVPKEKGIRIGNWLKDRNALLDLSDRFDTAIVDSYLAERKDYDVIHRMFAHLVVIDDYNRLSYPSDLVINPNAYAGEIDYRNQIARVVGGADFIMLRTPFIENRHRFVVREHVLNTLVTMGGDDIRGLVPGIINVLKESSSSLSVVGGTDQYRRQLKQYADEGCRVYGYADEKQMASLMLNADVAVSAAGQTLHELSCLGVPTIAVCIDHDQEPNLNSYHRRGFVPEPLRWDDPDLMGKIQRLASSMGSHRLRKRLSEKGKAMVDGNGITRILQLLNDRGKG